MPCLVLVLGAYTLGVYFTDSRLYDRLYGALIMLLGPGVAVSIWASGNIEGGYPDWRGDIIMVLSSWFLWSTVVYLVILTSAFMLRALRARPRD